MKYQILFSRKNNEETMKKYLLMSSAAIVTGALMVNKDMSYCQVFLQSSSVYKSLLCLYF